MTDPKPTVELPLIDHFLKGPTVEWEGLTVHTGLKIPVRRDTVLTLRLLSSESELTMGLIVHGIKCRLPLDDELVQGLRYWWGDPIPPEGELVTFQKVRWGAQAFVSPAWLEPGEVVRSGVGNAGLLIEETAPGRYLLRCSNGRAWPPDFDGLVAEVCVGPLD